MFSSKEPGLFCSSVLFRTNFIKAKCQWKKKFILGGPICFMKGSLSKERKPTKAKTCCSISSITTFPCYGLPCSHSVLDLWLLLLASNEESGKGDSVEKAC